MPPRTRDIEPPRRSRALTDDLDDHRAARPTRVGTADIGAGEGVSLEELRRRRREARRRRAQRRVTRRALALGALVLASVVAVVLASGGHRNKTTRTDSRDGRASEPSQDAGRTNSGASQPASRKSRTSSSTAASTPARPRTQSKAVGTYDQGRLVGGVPLAAESPAYFTWDPVRYQVPNRVTRRYGTRFLLRRLTTVLNAYKAANPGAPRVGVGDLSRPRGGDFGVRSGPIAHMSHQNGLDVDVYYPRKDRRERAPFRVEQIDRALAQELVDRFVRAGAIRVFVGPRTGLTGPANRVQPLVKHDDHLHARFAKPTAWR